MGQRLEQDVADYPKKKKRLYRNSGEWNLVDLKNISNPRKQGCFEPDSCDKVMQLPLRRYHPGFQTRLRARLSSKLTGTRSKSWQMIISAKTDKSTLPTCGM